MRAIHFVLLAWAALAGTAIAGEIGKTGDGAPPRTNPATIHFDLAAPKRVESLPTASTLRELTYANENRAAPEPAPQRAPRPAARARPRQPPRLARRAVAVRPTAGPWMSEWRRNYIAQHGHQPPVAVPR